MLSLGKLRLCRYYRGLSGYGCCLVSLLRILKGVSNDGVVFAGTGGGGAVGILWTIRGGGCFFLSTE